MVGVLSPLTFKDIGTLVGGGKNSTFLRSRRGCVCCSCCVVDGCNIVIWGCPGGRTSITTGQDEAVVITVEGAVMPPLMLLLGGPTIAGPPPPLTTTVGGGPRDAADDTTGITGEGPVRMTTLWPPPPIMVLAVGTDKVNKNRINSVSRR